MKLELSVAALTALEKKIRAARNEIRDIPSEIVETLLDFGALEASDHVLTGYDADGNVNVSVVTEQSKDGGKLAIVGSDVAYQEFGYGQVGHIGRNPKQPPEYEQGQRDSWIYRDENGHFRVSTGMQAQMPIYKASKAIREILPQVVKDAVENVIKGLRQYG